MTMYRIRGAIDDQVFAESPEILELIQAAVDARVGEPMNVGGEPTEPLNQPLVIEYMDGGVNGALWHPFPAINEDAQITKIVRYSEWKAIQDSQKLAVHHARIARIIEEEIDAFQGRVYDRMIEG